MRYHSYTPSTKYYSMSTSKCSTPCIRDYYTPAAPSPHVSHTPTAIPQCLLDTYTCHSNMSPFVSALRK